MRQAGVLAAAGIYALDNNVTRLADDHANAAALVAGLTEVEGVDVDYEDAQTNMVYVTVRDRDHSELVGYLGARGILCGTGRPLRLVAHLDITAEDVSKVIEAFEEFLAT